MKIKSLLIGMLACSAMVACTNEDVPEVDNGKVNAGDQAYIAVNISNSNVNSRGTSTTFENGIDEENAFEKATFFFFDNGGNPYNVSSTGNYVEKTFAEMNMQANSGNVEEISDNVLVISKSQDVPPQKMLVVLNAPEGLSGKTLGELRKEVAAYGLTTTDVTDDNNVTRTKVEYKNTAKFVISNSVYVNETTGKEVDAVDLTSSNIAPDATKALKNPVKIYVERTVAKVRVTDVRTDKSVNVTVKDNQGTDVAIHAQIVGWKVTNITKETNLLKKINTTWTGWTWNAPSNFRSYWADTEDKTVSHPWKYSELTNAAGTFDYYFENTKANVAEVKDNNDAVTTPAQHNKSQLLVAVKLVASTDASDTKANGVTICEWFGAKYTLDGLKTAIANSLNTQIYYASDKSSIKPNDITFFQEVDNKDGKRYVSYATLVDNSAITDATFIDADGKALTKAQVNTKLAAIQPALIWNEGMAYYYLDIEHFGTGDATHGLVRNHLYDITIGKIEGLGTPVYDPTKIITPEKPVDEYSFISAQINILAWKVVKQQNVTLK